MSLSIVQIKEKIKERRSDPRIRQAVLHENKLKLHAKPVTEQWQLSPYFRVWKDNKPYKLLPLDKAEKVISILALPFSTVELTDSIFSEISRIFNAQNKHFAYEFESPDTLADFESYLTDTLKIDYFMQTDVFDAFKWAINSIVIIDLPSLQDTLRPEPYAFVLSIDNVLDSSPLKGGGFEYLIYQSGDDYYAITTDRYIKMNKDYEVMVESEHNLGYVPAHFMWHKCLDDNPYDHTSPITNSLGELDWYLFWSGAKKYNDLTGAFPIYVAYEEQCDYEDPSDNKTCDNGYIDGDRKRPCPQCANKKMIGPGSMINIPAPMDKDDADLGANPVSKLDADTGSLEYCRDEHSAHGKYIFESCVGVDSGENVDVAKNEKQVASLYESRVNVLMRMKKGFELIHKWIIHTCADLRYEKGTIKGSTINYGTEFYLKTLADLYKQYTSAKADGLPDSELDTIYEEIISVKYKNNETQRKRLKILLNIEPYPHKNITEITALYDKGLINKDDFVIKINFNSFVKRFERENGPIETFGSKVDLKTRVENIYQRFKEYVKSTKLPREVESEGRLPD